MVKKLPRVELPCVMCGTVVEVICTKPPNKVFCRTNNYACSREYRGQRMKEMRINQTKPRIYLPCEYCNAPVEIIDGDNAYTRGERRVFCKNNNRACFFAWHTKENHHWYGNPHFPKGDPNSPLRREHVKAIVAQASSERMMGNTIASGSGDKRREEFRLGIRSPNKLPAGAYRGKNIIYESWIAGRVRLHSSYEHRFAQILDDAEIPWIRPIKPLPYISTDDGLYHNYFPDFLLDKTLYIEIKPEDFFDSYQSKYQAVVKENRILLGMVGETVINALERNPYNFMGVKYVK